MGISQIYGSISPLARYGFETFKVKPLTSLVVVGSSFFAVKAAFSNDKETKLAVNDIFNITATFLLLERIEPFFQKQFYKYPASTIIGGCAATHFCYRMIEQEKYKDNKALELRPFISCCLLAAGIRHYAPSLTSRLTWLR